ncbi:EamA family transporter [Staphylococcus massiliensis CCUG 55927]|nr:DMT family transporter [Staphylococcus massiliensis]PNZ99219.1 EamA family transporter [Staphylococcus massiliensis CCUG 55927]
MVQTDKRWFGYSLVIIGATCWGVGGTVTQWLFQKAHLPVGEFVAIRLILSGVLLLIVSYFINGRSMMYIWSHKSSVVKILIYGLLGMLGVQFTFMSAIKHGNAAVATLLQYLGPIVIILYYVMRKKATFKRKEAIAILLALSGTFLLLTNGQLDNLSVPMPAIIWGLISAIALAFYTIYPIPLFAQWGSLSVVGWAMLIGGIGLSFIYPPWHMDYLSWSMMTIICFMISIVFGTMIAFWFYIESLNYISPQEAGLLGTIEPLMAILTSVLWLHVSFGVLLQSQKKYN